MQSQLIGSIFIQIKEVKVLNIEGDLMEERDLQKKEVMMDQSISMRNLPDEFNFQLNILRQRMTYQLFLDLRNVEDTGRSEGIQNKTIQQRQQIFVRIYEKHINQLQKIQSSAELKIKQQELQADLSLVQNLYQFNQQCDIPATIEVIQKLILTQETLIDKIEEYINRLCDRIQHQKYLHHQKTICQHLHQQITIFKTRKPQLREIIENAKAQRKQWHQLAVNVCQDKQTDIQKLQTFKNQQQEEVSKQKSYSLQLNQKQAELYREISKLTLELNTNSLKSTKSEHMDKQFRPKKPIEKPNQKEFRSKNFGSIIEPMPVSDMENPSVIFSQQSDSPTQTQTPTCYVQSGIGKERKFAMLILLLLSILLWFV